MVRMLTQIVRDAGLSPSQSTSFLTKVALAVSRNIYLFKCYSVHIDYFLYIDYYKQLNNIFNIHVSNL